MQLLFVSFFLRCSACQELVRPKLARPSRIRPGDQQFNEIVYGDLLKIQDQEGTGWWFLLVIDDATDYTVVALVENHSSQALWDGDGRYWLKLAGPPDEWATGNERGLIGEKVHESTDEIRYRFRPRRRLCPVVKRKRGTTESLRKRNSAKGDKMPQPSWAGG